MNLSDFICYNKPEKTRDFRFSHVTRLSKLSTREERTGWMKKSKHDSDEHFKKLIGILAFYTAGQLKH